MASATAAVTATEGPPLVILHDENGSYDCWDPPVVNPRILYGKGWDKSVANKAVKHGGFIVKYKSLRPTTKLPPPSELKYTKRLQLNILTLFKEGADAIECYHPLVSQKMEIEFQELRNFIKEARAGSVFAVNDFSWKPEGLADRGHWGAQIEDLFATTPHSQIRTAFGIGPFPLKVQTLLNHLPGMKVLGQESRKAGAKSPWKFLYGPYLTVATAGSVITARKPLLNNRFVYHNHGEHPWQFLLIPSEFKMKFENIIIHKLGGRLPNLCSQFVSHLSLWITPKQLRSWAIPFVQITLGKGYLICIHPDTYYMGRSTGYSVLERLCVPPSTWSYDEWKFCDESTALCKEADQQSAPRVEELDNEELATEEESNNEEPDDSDCEASEESEAEETGIFQNHTAAPIAPRGVNSALSFWRKIIIEDEKAEEKKGKARRTRVTTKKRMSYGSFSILPAPPAQSNSEGFQRQPPPGDQLPGNHHPQINARNFNAGPRSIGNCNATVSQTSNYSYNNSMRNPAPSTFQHGRNVNVGGQNNQFTPPNSIMNQAPNFRNQAHPTYSPFPSRENFFGSMPNRLHGQFQNRGDGLQGPRHARPARAVPPPGTEVIDLTSGGEDDGSTGQEHGHYSRKL